VNTRAFRDRASVQISISSISEVAKAVNPVNMALSESQSCPALLFDEVFDEMSMSLPGYSNVLWSRMSRTEA
jgi:hypothetical protein